MPRYTRVGTCTLIAVMMATGLPTARAAAPEAAPPAAAASATDGSAAAKQQFAVGLERYEANDFAGAITAWTSARAEMAADPSARDAWHVLGLDLAQAHVRAYRVDSDASHFEPAERLLEEYLEWVDRPGTTMTDAQREDRPRAIEMLAFIERERETEVTAPAPVIPAEPDVTSPRPATPPVDTVDRSKRLGRARGMIIGGGVALGLGVGASIAVLSLLGPAARLERRHEMLVEEDLERTEQGQPPQNRAAIDDVGIRGARINGGVIAGSVAAAALGVAGIALLTTGLVQRKRVLRGTPVLGRGYAGLQLTLSF